MRNKPTQEQINRLPKWAQEHIDAMNRRINEFQNTVNKMLIDQVEREPWHKHTIYENEFIDGEFKKRYFVARHITMETDSGVKVDITEREGAIDISTDGPMRLEPRATNHIRVLGDKQ